MKGTQSRPPYDGRPKAFAVDVCRALDLTPHHRPSDTPSSSLSAEGSSGGRMRPYCRRLITLVFAGQRMRASHCDEGTAGAAFLLLRALGWSPVPRTK